MDSLELANVPREVTLGGKTYLVSKLTKGEWDAFQLWLREHTTDPVVGVFEALNKARAAGIAVHDEDRKALYMAARAEARHWPPPIMTAGWFDLIGDDAPSRRLLWAVLRKHQPTLAEAEAEAIEAGATRDELSIMAARALGFDPAPKGDAPTPTGDAPPATIPGSE